jgi:hypothetical protein
VGVTLRGGAAAAGQHVSCWLSGCLLLLLVVVCKAESGQTFCCCRTGRAWYNKKSGAGISGLLNNTVVMPQSQTALSCCCWQQSCCLLTIKLNTFRTGEAGNARQEELHAGACLQVAAQTAAAAGTLLLHPTSRTIITAYLRRWPELHS